MILFLSQNRILNTQQIACGFLLVDDPQAQHPNLTGLRLKMAGGHTLELNAEDGGAVVNTINRENQLALLSGELLDGQAAQSALRAGGRFIKP